METRQLKYFVAVVDAGSMMQASTRLYIAQPALSEQMRKLEAELGLPLLLRHAKGVTPTEAGLALYRQAEIILRLMAETREAVRRTKREVAGRVRIGMPVYVSAMLAATLIGSLRKRHPSIDLEIHEHGGINQVLQLLNDDVDVSLVTDDPARRPGLAVGPMLQERIHWVTARTPAGDAPDDAPDAAQQAARREPIGWAQALAGPAVWPSISLPTYRAMLMRAIEPLGLRPRIAAEATTAPILVNLVADGVGGCPMPALAFVAHPRRAQIQYHPIEPPLYRQTSFAYPTMYPLSEAAQQVRQAMREIVGDCVARGLWPDAHMLPPPPA